MADEKNKGGRPRKPDPTPEQTPQKKSSYPNTAIGISKIGEKYAIVKIPYNPTSGEAGAPEIQLCNGDEMDVEYNFRDLVDVYIDENLFKEKA